MCLGLQQAQLSRLDERRQTAHGSQILLNLMTFKRHQFPGDRSFRGTKVRAVVVGERDVIGVSGLVLSWAEEPQQEQSL